MIRKFVPSFVKEQVRRRRRRTVLQGLTLNNILANMHLPYPVHESDDIFSRNYSVRESGTGKDGLPLPPEDLAMGYLRSGPEHYIDGGQDWSENLRSIADKYGTNIEGGAVLDWGCSTGRVLRHFIEDARSGKTECWGTDLEAPAIAWARDHLGPIKFVTCSSLPHLPFPDGKFNFIYALSVMTHVEHFDDMWLVELDRVLAPGGVMVLTIHDEHTIEYFKENGPDYWIPDEIPYEKILDEQERAILFGRDPVTTFTFYRDDYIRRVWGTYFTVKEIIPRWAAGSKQSAVILVKT